MDRKTVTERGFAKINLHLDITGRMPDGYHRVETVMQTVSLSDEITVSLREEKGFFATCNVAGVPSDEKNIAVRAANLFCERVGCSFGGEIHIEKSIPMAAGMAGGSADGAATLRALNRLCGMPLTTEELCAIGASLGADVPFCIVGGMAYADGRGDVLHPFPSMPDCCMVVACEGEGVSTPWGYGVVDRRYGNFEDGCGYIPRGTERLREALKHQDLSALSQYMYNIFEEPVLAERPVAAKIRELLLKSGAMGAMMSGSGPSVFAIFETDAAAEQAAETLKKEGYRPYLCHPITPEF